MRTRLPRIAGLVLVCALLAAPPAPVSGASADRLAPPARPDGLSQPEQRLSQARFPQTSDRVRGAIAAPMSPLVRRLSTRVGPSSKRVVSPGVTYTTWSQTDARGPIRAHLLAVDLSTPGLRLDYASAGAVRRTDQVSDILARDRAVAGVNGDFFDIGDTGAPLGLGQDRQRGLLHAPRGGWNSAFWLDEAGRPDIGYLPLKAAVKFRPNLRVTNVNSPEVRAGGIGVYTPTWGASAGYRWTGGQTKQVRMLRVVDGRVVETRNKLPANTLIRGFLLIGRGEGARRLAGLAKGARVDVEGWLQGRPQVAITGNKFLIRNGVFEVINDREMHPRTAIGIDRDTGEVLLLAIDGRQSFSRGYTMVELAEMMQDLGADEALNLDGGGSTTMVARRPNGTIGVVNSPSDGFQRSVANALEVTYTAP
ncbi:phosphodiester glycosidase family protein [Nocardioides sp.]|uniref:phosphodiester glycosidase family protein n=1 Tax=Nocardioides sp. TaxID=35761 RepID=UPI00286B6755|nr:phosphodiester glycosidase family protein [Nocardioides sp.]